MTNPLLSERIVVVIPSYKVIGHIVDVILKIPAMVWHIYVIDDACPAGSGKFVEKNIDDERVRVICHLLKFPLPRKGEYDEMGGRFF